MLRIPCPFCGERDYTEFAFWGDARFPRPANPQELSDNEWTERLFHRDNPAGQYLEYWHHALGCRGWFIIQRDTRTHLISPVCRGGEDRA